MRMPSISMSSVWVKISTILFLCYTAETHWVQKEVGDQITIQCAIDSKEEFLYLQRGINKEENVYVRKNGTENGSPSEKMRERIQTHGKFPNVQILIKKLNTNDTNVYWCVYTKTDELYKTIFTEGNGAVLLVVTEKGQTPSTIPGTEPSLEKDNCGSSDNTPLYIIICVAALLIIILSFIMWSLRKNKSSDNRVKMKRMANNNDVYEDMRGTIRH